MLKVLPTCDKLIGASLPDFRIKGDSPAIYDITIDDQCLHLAKSLSEPALMICDDLRVRYVAGNSGRDIGPKLLILQPVCSV